MTSSFPPIFVARHLGRHDPNNFIKKNRISRRKSKPPLKSSLQFKISREAAEHNAKQLSYHDFDVSKLVSENKNSTISYGSEFQEPALLHLPLRNHPLWVFLRKTLEEGVDSSLRWNNQTKTASEKTPLSLTTETTFSEQQ
jgi:hypothetical protein